MASNATASGKGSVLTRILAIALLSGAMLIASEAVGHAQDAASNAASAAGAQSSPVISGEQVESVIKQPIHDLNLMQPDLAPVLRKALDAPYAAVGDCQSLGQEVKELDTALGPDLDTADPKDGSLKTKAVGMALDGARDAASSFIPYRGAIRFVTGAERHDRKTAKAMLAGEIRRGYLKGIAQERGCRTQGPAAEPQVSQAN